MDARYDKDKIFDDIIKEGKALLEEVIEQSDDMAAYNPDSVNTVRVSTFYTRNGIEAPWGFFRTGRKGSFIDNCAAGGVFASIDTKHGITCSSGCDERGNRFDFHPDSGKLMKDFCLPDWKEAITLCKEAAQSIPALKYLSWDLAHTKKYGWVIVEVNTCGQFMQQAGSLQGVKRELKAILDKMDLLVPYHFIRD